jgi:hypothetical protein
MLEEPYEDYIWNTLIRTIINQNQDKVLEDE